MQQENLKRGRIFCLTRYVQFFLLGIVLASCQPVVPSTPTAEQGIIDFSDWSFEQDGIAHLDGEWKFYWGEFINNTSQLVPIQQNGLCHLPGYWMEEVEENTYHEQNGIVTYHLKLILPDSLQVYSLKLNSVYTAYQLWADGELLTKVGKVTKNAETSMPDFETKLVPLPRKKQLNLFLQVASWEHRRGGGTPETMLIGTQEQITENWLINYTIQLVSFSIIVTLSIYLVVLFGFYPSNPSYLYIGMFAILGGLRAICVDEIIIKEVFDDFPYFWNQRLRYIGFFASIGFMVLAIKHIFSGFASKFLTYGAYILFLFSIATLLIPFRWSSYLSPLFQVFCIPLTAWALYAIIKSFLENKNRLEAVIFGMGGLVLFIAMFQSIIIANNLAEGKLYHIVSYTLFIFLQVLLLAHRNKTIFNKANMLSQELTTLNKHLEEKVENRTLEITVQKNQLSQQAQKLEAAYEELKELDEAKSRFFSNISHELRTPLTLILGSTNRLKEQLDKVATQEQLHEVRLVEKQSAILHRLINQLLDLTKLEAGKLQLHVQKEPLVELISAYFFSFEGLAKQKGLQLYFEQDVELEEMYLDRQVMEKIVYNLVSNACKFTPSGGTVVMRLHQDTEHLILTIQDTGLGISEKDLPHVFDRFYQANHIWTNSYEGTGIGLALVQELVGLHGGEISVKSTVGDGTSFIIQLPLNTPIPLDNTTPYLPENNYKADMLLTQELAITDTSTAKKTTKPLVLLVEDHADLQDFLKRELSGSFTILLAKNGQEGIEQAIKHVPDLIVSDVMMPIKDGYELCERLKQDVITSHIPIILLTAKVSQASKIEGLAIGADDYLAKPFDSKELRIRIQNLIETRRKLKAKFAVKEEIIPFKPQEIAQNTIDQAFIEQLWECLEAHFQDSNFGAEQLANEMILSRRQLNRKLSAIMDSSSSKVLQNFRLQKAKDLLQDQHIKMKEVGYAVGFSTPAYFHKCFHDKFAMTPRAYQKSLSK